MKRRRLTFKNNNEKPEASVWWLKTNNNKMEIA